MPWRPPSRQLPSACDTTTLTPAPTMRNSTNGIADSSPPSANAAPLASPSRAAKALPSRPIGMPSSLSMNSGAASGSKRGAGGAGGRAWRTPCDAVVRGPAAAVGLLNGDSMG